MTLIPRLAVVIVLMGGFLGVGKSDARLFRLELSPIAIEYRSPVYVADPGDGTDRLFVVEQRGVIKIVHGNVPSRNPYLDVRDLVEDRGSEQGLLSLAFHPDYARNRSFYIAYTDPDDALVVASLQARKTRPDRADPDTHRVILRIEKRYTEHNGGLLLFGPDGYLYIGVGDGGREAEPENNSQRLDTLLGKLLRIDVDRPGEIREYGIPPDNPFVGVPGTRPEIWAYGLRNPWRFSFDRTTGDLYIADVGSGGPEEVNIQSAGSPGGENYGWKVFEGPRCHHPNDGEQCNGEGMIAPIWGYEHPKPEDGCAIVGGYVYRGTAFPELVGSYLTADVCAGRVWSLQPRNGEWEATVLFELKTIISSFAEDSAGELYLVGLRGQVFQLARGADTQGEDSLAFTCLAALSRDGGWHCTASGGADAN